MKYVTLYAKTISISQNQILVKFFSLYIRHFELLSVVSQLLLYHQQYLRLACIPGLSPREKNVRKQTMTANYVSRTVYINTEVPAQVKDLTRLVVPLTSKSFHIAF